MSKLFQFVIYSYNFVGKIDIFLMEMLSLVGKLYIRGDVMVEGIFDLLNCLLYWHLLILGLNLSW